MARETSGFAQDEKVFSKPRWGAERLDWCLNWGADCGQPAADNFCKRRRFTGARNFDADPNIGLLEATRVSGTDQVCNQGFCTGFKFITCYGSISSERIFPNPVWKEHRLDLCLHWGTDCGKPAADAFCRDKGFSESSSFVQDAVPGLAHTRLIGTDQICDQSFCVGFQRIVCQ